ncbi:12911_t:CDS:1, partial [Ambispora gerdemannii]
MKFHPLNSYKVKQMLKFKDPILNDKKFAILFGTTSNSHQIK